MQQLSSAQKEEEWRSGVRTGDKGEEGRCQPSGLSRAREKCANHRPAVRRIPENPSPPSFAQLVQAPLDSPKDLNAIAEELIRELERDVPRRWLEAGEEGEGERKVVFRPEEGGGRKSEGGG